LKKILVLLFAAFALPATALSVCAGEISVTSVHVNGNEASVVINEVVEINEIEISGNDVKFPAYISKSNKVFPQVNFLTETARNTVVEAVLNNKPSSKRIRSINYKVNKMSPYNKEGSSLKAFASVVFNGALEVECKVMKSRRDDDLWIAWPARPPKKDKGERRWQDQVRIINKKVKSIIERDIVETFKNTGPGGAVMTDVDVDVKRGNIDAPLTVTAVDVKKVEGDGDLVAVASVDLNYSFRINDIKVYRRRGETFIEFPVYVSGSGREYDQIKIFSRTLRSEIRKAIETGQASGEKSDKIGFEITKFEPFWKESALKYFCAVTINGAAEIECKIIDGPSYQAFVGWPSTKEDGSYVDKIVPCNLEVKNVIEETLLERYHKEKKE